MMKKTNLVLAAAGSFALAGCVVENSGTGGSATIDHGGYVQNRCAEAVARQVGVTPNDVVVTRTTVSEGTGLNVVYVGVPNATADWICEATQSGEVRNVFFSGQG